MYSYKAPLELEHHLVPPVLAWWVQGGVIGWWEGECCIPTLHTNVGAPSATSCLQSIEPVLKTSTSSQCESVHRASECIEPVHRASASQCIEPVLKAINSSQYEPVRVSVSQCLPFERPDESNGSVAYLVGVSVGCWVLGLGCWDVGVGCWVVGVEHHWVLSAEC